VFLEEVRGWSLTWTQLRQAAPIQAHGLFMFVTIVMAPTPQDCWAAITKYGRWLRGTTKQFEAARASLYPLGRKGLTFRFCFLRASCVPNASRVTGHQSGVTSLATLFPTWLANASANTSSPISAGAKRSPAPSAFRPIPRYRFRATINIAGSKSVQDMVR